MTPISISITPMSSAAFAPFGDVIALQDTPDFIINQKMCARYHDLAKLAFDQAKDQAKDQDEDQAEDQAGAAGISLFDAVPRCLPYHLEMMERHPLGSQAFLPLHQNPFLVIVAADENGRPGRPIAFKTAPSMGINYHKNIWHGVLTPLFEPGLFAVIDRIGGGVNLEEFWFDKPIIIEE